MKRNLIGKNNINFTKKIVLIWYVKKCIKDKRIYISKFNSTKIHFNPIKHKKETKLFVRAKYPHPL